MIRLSRFMIRLIRFIRFMHGSRGAGWLKFSSSKLGTTGDSNHHKNPPACHGVGPHVGAGRQLVGAGQNDTSGGLDPRHSGRNLGRGGACRLTFCALVLRRFGSVGGAGRRPAAKLAGSGSRCPSLQRAFLSDKEALCNEGRLELAPGLSSGLVPRAQPNASFLAWAGPSTHPAPHQPAPLGAPLAHILW